eukprot:CAMPEP_0116989226 /NCGR_PEP_ID=MMETSP0467-20121206/64681_1 /TAXON_ID=283647 /ORGANISM="Mesodinium pulex, Strain SPMC105" /LENGTH=67 /DNA_ID=CAMNT_0004685607 /DNA_START=555 /DNA_END=755 /DNA_ORIENTATION=-
MALEWNVLQLTHMMIFLFVREPIDSYTLAPTTAPGFTCEVSFKYTVRSATSGNERWMVSMWSLSLLA